MNETPIEINTYDQNQTYQVKENTTYQAQDFNQSTPSYGEQQQMN
jgi:hypothetical protein